MIPAYCGCGGILDYVSSIPVVHKRRFKQQVCCETVTYVTAKCLTCGDYSRVTVGAEGIKSQVIFTPDFK
jgi:hypothetical protein